MCSISMYLLSIRLFFWIHSNQNQNSNQLVDTMMSFPGIDNGCLDKPSNPYVITPQMPDYWFLRVIHISVSQGAKAQFLYIVHCFLTYGIFIFPSLSFLSWRLFSCCFILLVWLPAIPAALSGFSHPPLYFPAVQLNVCG